MCLPALASALDTAPHRVTWWARYRSRNASREAFAMFEAEARKILEALGDRAQAELKVLISAARSDTRDRIADLGAELEKLGRKVQELARTPAAKNEPAETGPNGPQTPVN